MCVKWIKLYIIDIFKKWRHKLQQTVYPCYTILYGLFERPTAAHMKTTPAKSAPGVATSNVTSINKFCKCFFIISILERNDCWWSRVKRHIIRNLHQQHANKHVDEIFAYTSAWPDLILLHFREGIKKAHIYDKHRRIVTKFISLEPILARV